MTITADKTHAEKLADKLIELRNNVTREDRLLAAEKFEIHYETISRYLNGKAPDPDTSFKLISFFKERIEAREASINQ